MNGRAILELAGRAAIIVLGGVALGFAANAARPDGVNPASFAAPVSCALPGTAVERLSPEQAAALCGDATAVIADARSPARFAEGHIADAIHLPCSASGVAASDAIARLAGKRTVVVYGDTTEEALAVAESLRRLGALQTLRVVVLEGGFPAWSSAGLACSSGPCPTCAETHGAGAHP